MKIYAGIDLHSNNNFVALIDEENKAVYKKRLLNDLTIVLEALKPYKDSVEGVVVESTYNWYWLADGLREAGYKVHLATYQSFGRYIRFSYCLAPLTAVSRYFHLKVARLV